MNIVRLIDKERKNKYDSYMTWQIKPSNLETLNSY